MPLSILNRKIALIRSRLIADNRVNLTQSNLRGWTVGLTAAIVVLGIIYLGQINSLATRGYEMKNIESRKADLTAQSEQMQVQIAEIRSTETLLQRIEALELVPVGKVSYINAASPDVAFAK